MRTLYLDCSMGAAGDMLMAALMELVPSPDSFITRLNYLGIPGVNVKREPSDKCGINGTHIIVEINGETEEEHLHSHEGEHLHSHQHGNLNDMRAIINSLELSDEVKNNAIKVYYLIAESESKVHGVPVAQVHFHEVGAMDAITDVIGVCMLMEELAPSRIIASPVHVGSGQVQCAHGILPVPAPATADLLRGIPIYGGDIKGELCTPTGAALLRHFVTNFGSMPVMAVHGVGYGMGTNDYPSANCLRAMIGEQSSPYGPNDRITTLSCNLDDMTGEAIGFACRRLMELGALDVFTIPIVMKKGRPAQMLVCMSSTDNADNLAAEILRHTTTFGVRRTESSRYILDRTVTSIPTKYGEISLKSGMGYGVEKVKPEYDDIANAAEQNGLSIGEVLQALEL